MIFAFSTDDGGLMSFSSQAEAISYAEGIDVEDGVWRFFSDNGAELQPVFASANSHGRVIVVSGTYVLVPSANASPGLQELIPNIRSYEGIVGSQAELLAFLKEKQCAGAAQPTVQRDGPASGGSAR